MEIIFEEKRIRKKRNKQLLKKNKNITIIPARGGSKRLPDKNILSLGNIPLLAHSIIYAQQFPDIIDDIVVSTDDKKIKQIAIKYGAKVIERPKELSGDYATTVSALKHVLLSEKRQIDNVILLQATNPLRPKNLLKGAYQKFKETNSDSLMTVTRNHQKFGKIIDNKFQPYNYEIGQRSQELEPIYYENGLLYIMKTELILQDKILGVNNFPFIVNHPFSSIDIDTKEDLELAQYYFQKFQNE